MDDALIPKTMGGGTRTIASVIAACSVILFLVSVICAFIKGTQQYYSAYVIQGIAMALLVVSTGMLVRWILSDELPESKHTYVVILQFLALIALSCGMLASVYMTLPKEYAVFGLAANASGFGGQVQLKGTATDGSDLKLSASFGSSQQLFSFEDHLRGGSEYTITVKNPDGSACTPTTQSGTVSGDVKVQLSCKAASILSGIATGVGPEGATASITLKCIEIGSGPQTQQTLTVSQQGRFQFDTPILNGDTYLVSLDPPPTDAKCYVNNPSGPGPLTVSCNK